MERGYEPLKSKSQIILPIQIIYCMIIYFETTKVLTFFYFETNFKLQILLKFNIFRDMCTCTNLPTMKHMTLLSCIVVSESFQRR